LFEGVTLYTLEAMQEGLNIVLERFGWVYLV
jgi:hypothetical protein